MNEAPLVIGRFALHHIVAAGGMGTVHLGRMRSTSGLSRTVAVKRVHAHYASEPEFARMFFDEARLAMRVQHPNVVSTFDAVAEGTELLLVMDYIHGESLAGLLRAVHSSGASIPPRIAVGIVSGLLSGLHAAHEARGENGEPLEIIHRDISPQNVMVGVDGVARVLDFGIAKAAGRLHTTQEGHVKGKFAYMSPEQLASMPLDRRSDLFAVAIVLWEALSGRRLFEADSPAGIVTAVLSREVQPPSRFAATPIPEALDAVVMKGLSRHRDERFTTAREMAAVLERAAAPAPHREIGEWVETVAADVLARRATQVAEVESQGSQVSQDHSVTHTVVAADAGESQVPTETSPSVDVPVLRERGEGRSRGARIAAISLGTLAMVGLFVVVATRGMSSATPIAAANDPTSTTASSPPSPTAAPGAVSSSSPSSPSSAASTATTPEGTASGATSALVPSPRRPPKLATPARKPDCRNNIVLDSRGIRVPRPECF